MPRNDKFPSPTELEKFLNNEDSTSTDVIQEFQELFNPTYIFSVCQTAEDFNTYHARLKGLAKKLKASLPNDQAMKYFLYGKFVNRLEWLSDSWDKMSHSNLHNADEI